MYPYRTTSDNQYPDNYNQNQALGTRKGNYQKLYKNSTLSKSKDFSNAYYAYGKSAAIEFVCDETKKQRIHTISLHAASARQDDTHGYDWDNKTTIQLPRNELLAMAAVMLNLLPKAEFKHHSAYGSKSYSIEHQREKVFVMVAEKGKPIRAVALSPEDTFQVVTLVFKQIKANANWLTVGEIMQLIELTVVKMKRERLNGHDDYHRHVEEADYDDDDQDEDDEADVTDHQEAVVAEYADEQEDEEDER